MGTMTEGGKPELIHFVGVGGSGMSALAQILLGLNMRVSGSDIKANDNTRRLSAQGARISIGHHGDQVENATAVILSSAIQDGNPEVTRARSLGIRIFNRAELLALIMDGQQGIAIAGTHGKTTTTSMVGLVLDRAGLDPTVIVGGEVSDYGGNAKLGYGNTVVVEADESDGSFLYLSPKIAIVTNIDEDHMDYYANRHHLMDTFRSFVQKLPENGRAVVCVDDPNVEALIPTVGRPLLTYGLRNPRAQYRAKNVVQNPDGTTFELWNRSRRLGTFELRVPGLHNVLNATATLVVAHHLGLDLARAREALALFVGAARRFQRIGETAGVAVIDDYAHHPTEVAALLAAGRQAYPKGRVLVVFQPHRYSRTARHYHEFARALTAADAVVLTEVYAASEKPLEGISSLMITEAAREMGRSDFEVVSDFANLAEMISGMARTGDVVFTVGAGDVNALGPRILECLAASEPARAAEAVA